MAIPFNNIPGPENPDNLFKTFQTMQKWTSDTIGSVEEAFEAYGDVVRLSLGGDMVLMRHPEHLHEVMVTKAKAFNKGFEYTDEKRGLARFVGNGILTSNGDFWRKQRKQVAPAFHTQRITAYAEAMVQAGDEMLNRWPDQGVLDISHEMMTVTLKIIAGTLFQQDLSSDVDRIDQAMDDINAYNGKFSILPTWMPTPMERRARRAKQDLDEIVYQQIEAWRRHGKDNGSLLSMLMLAEDDEGNHMRDEQVRDEAVTLLLAGHETTANALNWTFMLLSQNPDVAAKLHEEIDSVLQGRLPSLADLRNLPYTEMVIKEGMRLYPPAWSVGRLAMEDLQIGDYEIKAGTGVNMSIVHMHRDPRWWEDAMAFRPERFAPENADKINKYAYMPFGGGPRVCVGNSFAQLEAHLLLATIAQRYTLSLRPGQVVTPEARITMFPRGGLPMQVQRREAISHHEARAVAQPV
ncbi:cytochrome P450 [Phototrophicus methaneseepsis]|uniref:Cytochrome P450 n=1 Tax=Phototrophicus methaneseepsis TaxID=2710758 RepID=A0A7S8IFG6_9CHLR|nr:cytochrome P450 [Phototrophicus methaneseepsis]QPC82933.1 cytochrome P450 [Phototrophicus methaneseepsis]